MSSKVEHFVTLFNSTFLPQGVALHQSMQLNIKDYVLWVLCVDNETYDVLNKLELQNVRLIKLSEVETKELLKVKSSRTKGEYCWTLTPFAPDFVFNADKLINRVTYIDADIWFRQSPKPIFDEFDNSNKKVLITDHSYSPHYDQSKMSGKYCVQIIIFDKLGSKDIRKWWREKCIDWCFNRFEDGKLGDQKYLESWPVLFPEKVHILLQTKFVQAPWNSEIFSYSDSLIYHFHGLRISSKKCLNTGFYRIPEVVLENIYKEYIVVLKKAVRELVDVGFTLKIQADKENSIKKVLRRINQIRKFIINVSPKGTINW